jgi:hypothetical protein
LLIKTDSAGNKQWDQTFSCGYIDRGYSVQQTYSGGYIIAGETGSLGTGHSEVWVIKTDSAGNKQWDQTFGGDYDDRGRSVRQTSDGGYVITGFTESFGSGFDDVWLIRMGTRFASFDLTKVKIKFAEVENEDSFALNGRFTLSPESNGIDLTADDVVVKIGEFMEWIPAGSFWQNGEKFRFEGALGGITEAKINMEDGAFKIMAEGIDLTGVTTNLATIELTIGNDKGAIEVRLSGELIYNND